MIWGARFGATELHARFGFDRELTILDLGGRGFGIGRLGLRIAAVEFVEINFGESLGYLDGAVGAKIVIDKSISILNFANRHGLATSFTATSGTRHDGTSSQCRTCGEVFDNYEGG